MRGLYWVSSLQLILPQKLSQNVSCERAKLNQNKPRTTICVLLVDSPLSKNLVVALCLELSRCTKKIEALGHVLCSLLGSSRYVIVEKLHSTIRLREACGMFLSPSSLFYKGLSGLLM